MQGWAIYLYGKWLDTVFYDENMGESEVWSSLVNHDGFDTAIQIFRSRGQ